jgi:AcrR family transcriptional regulator
MDCLYDRAVAPVSETGRPRRRDAERNRETLLAAAREAFAEGGVAVGVDQIARRAGVGPATLYRHFPSKAELIDAILSETAQAMCEVIRGASMLPDATEALREVVHRILDEQVRDRTFRDLLAWHNAESAAEVPALVELAELLAGIIARAQEAGVLRLDVTLGDLILMLVAFDSVAAPAATVTPSAMHRVADVALDGLMAGTTRLKGAPLELEQLGQVASHGRGLPDRPAS